MQIADERCFPSAPCIRQVRQPHRRSRDSSPACVENSVQSGQYRSTEQPFHGPMKVHVQSSQPRNSENNPSESRSDEEETQQTHPNRSSLVKRTQSSIDIAKGEKRSDDEAHRQKAEDQFDPEHARCVVSCGRKRPRLIEEKMGQKKHGLNNCNETD